MASAQRRRFDSTGALGHNDQGDGAWIPGGPALAPCLLDSLPLRTWGRFAAACRAGTHARNAAMELTKQNAAVWMAWVRSLNWTQRKWIGRTLCRPLPVLTAFAALPVGLGGSDPRAAFAQLGATDAVWGELSALNNGNGHIIATSSVFWSLAFVNAAFGRLPASRMRALFAAMAPERYNRWNEGRRNHFQALLSMRGLRRALLNAAFDFEAFGNAVRELRGGDGSLPNLIAILDHFSGHSLHPMPHFSSSGVEWRCGLCWALRPSPALWA